MKLTKHKSRLHWLQARRIGGSDAPAAVGVSPWKSKLALHYEKTGEIEPDDLSENGAVQFGSRVEPVLRQWIGELLDQKIRYDGPYSLWTSDKYQWMTASLDGHVRMNADVGELFAAWEMPIPDDASEGLLEIKTASAFAADEWRQQWPLHYQIQCQHNLIVVGYDWGVVAVCVGNDFPQMIPFWRNEEFCEALIKSEREFWTGVEKREPPEIDGSEATLAVIKKLWPEETGETVELPEEAVIWDAALQEAKGRRKEIDATIRENEAKLRDAIADASVGVLSDGTQYTLKTTKRNGYTVKPCEYRVLRRKGAK